MKPIHFGVLVAVAGFLGSAVLADPARASMSCGISLHHKESGQVSKAEFAAPSSELDQGTWATAVFLGEGPIEVTVGLSATLESSDVLIAEIATGRQPLMAEGPGRAASGTLLETTRVHIDGQVQLIFDVPKYGIEVVCTPEF
jgi:hypothetical protein